MQKSSIDLDWNMVRALHATASTGSLSAAARSLGLTQPTLSRQIAALEEQLNVILFDRIGKRLVLTETGKALLPHARSMDEAASELSLAATGRSGAMTGKVSISASDIYAAYVLPEVLPKIRKQHPEICISIIATNNFSDLRRREADIAIRHARPKEPELIGKLLHQTTAHFYASRNWVKKNGLPKTKEDLAQVEWLGFEDLDQYIKQLHSMGIMVTPAQFRLTSANAFVLWEMVKRDQGIAAMVKNVAEKSPGIVRVLPNLPPIPVPVWLVTHRELRTSGRIRAVFDILAETLG